MVGVLHAFEAQGRAPPRRRPANQRTPSNGERSHAGERPETPHPRSPSAASLPGLPRRRGASSWRCSKNCRTNKKGAERPFFSEGENLHAVGGLAVRGGVQPF